MKTKSKTIPTPRRDPTEEEIRDYAFHLYEMSGCLPGRDLDNWLEAKACLEADVPRPRAQARLHHDQHRAPAEPLVVVTLDPEGMPQRDPPQPVEGRTEGGAIAIGTPPR